MGQDHNWAKDRERVDGLGAVTARIFPAIKKRPEIRRIGMQAIMTGSRLAARARNPLHRRTDRYRVVPSTEAWAAGQSNVRFTPTLTAERSINLPPKSVAGIVDQEYETIADVQLPQPFVVELPEGRVVGEHGVIVTDDGTLLHDLSLPMGGLRSHLWGSHGTIPDEHQLPTDWALPPRRLHGSVAVLSAFVGRGYFHWVFDVLPRLRLLREAGFDLEDFDAFVVPGYFARFQVETLTALGIPRKKIVSNLLNRHVQADRLVVPSLVRPTGLVPRWACDFLREAFPPTEPKHVSIGDRAYIVRRVTDHGFLSGEDTLVEYLRSRRFEPLATENLTFSEKAWVFARLEAVVSPEGAGLSNIVFSRPGAKVIELRVRDLPAMDFAVIANRLGLDFYDVYGDDYQRDLGEPTVRQGPITAEHVLATFALAGID
jgi:hypothetical protein